MRIEIEVEGHVVVVRDLEPADEQAVLDVFTACEDWFVAETGQPSAPGDVQSAFYAIPEGSDFDDKVLLVIETGGETVGFIDAVRRYPHIAAVAIGTFLIRPEYRRHGIGRAVARALFAAAAESDFAQIDTHVTQGWEPGRKFLAALGFTLSAPRPARRTVDRNVGAGEDRLVIPAVIAIG